VVTIYGVCALTSVMTKYALESRGPIVVLVFSAGCAPSSSCGFLSGAWPFGVVVAAVWTLVAWRRRLAAGTAARRKA
jgi:hypothetical protein